MEYMRLKSGYTIKVWEVSYKGSSYRREEYTSGNYSWGWCIGESIETIYDDKELEDAFRRSLG